MGRQALRSRATGCALVWILALAGLVLPPTAAAQTQVSEAANQSTRDLTLRQAIEMALEQNLRVQISRMSTEVSREGIRRSRGFLDPTVTFDVPSSLSSSITPQASQIDGAVVSVSNSFRGGFTWSERLIWGTRYSVGWTGSRSSNNSTFTTVNPRFQSGLSFQISQPLLQGFGRDIATAPIIVAGYSYSRSQEQLRVDTQQIALDTYRAYWDLVFRYQELGVRRESLQLAQRQAQRSDSQLRLGTANQLDVVQGEVRVADEEVRVLQAELAVQDAQDELKRLLNVDELGPGSWDVDISPTDTPEYVLRPLDLEASIATALERDPQLAQLRFDAESQQVQLDTAANNLLPTLDVSANLGLSGQGGDRIIRGGDLGGAETQVIEGGLSESLANLFSGDFRNWSVGLTLTMPIKNTEARAAHAQAELQQRQADLRIRDREQLLRMDLRAAIRRLESLRQQVEGAVLAREAAERQFQLAELQSGLGSGDVFQLLTFQVDLANAQSRELQLIIDFNNAYAQLEATQGTLLESLGILFQD